MKAVIFREYGSPEQLVVDRLPDPSPKADEVVIRLHSIGLNHLDLDIRAGISGIPVALPHILGLEGAGEVVAVGARVTTFAIGDRVAPTFLLSSGHCKERVCYCERGQDNLCAVGGFLGVTRPGTYAEYVTAAEGNCILLPDGLSYDLATAVQVTMATAWQMVVDQLRVRPGETVLVNAAGGGVGSAAVQIAHLCGARVIASAGEDTKLDHARALGADATINYRSMNLAAAVRDLTDGHGVDAVVESVGGETFADSVEVLVVGGRLATCGAHAGETVPLSVVDLFRRQLSVFGTHGASRSQIAEVYRLVAAGKLTPQIHSRFALEDAVDAHRLAESRKFFGKILLHPGGATQLA